MEEIASQRHRSWQLKRDYNGFIVQAEFLAVLPTVGMYPAAKLLSNGRRCLSSTLQGKTKSEILLSPAGRLARNYSLDSGAIRFRCKSCYLKSILN